MKKYITLILILISVIKSKAQEINITVSVNTTQSLSRLSDLQELALKGQLYITMQNLTQSRKEFTLEAVMKSDETGFEIKTNPEFDIDYTLGAGETKTLRFDDLKELFYADSFVLANGELATTYFENNLDGTIPSGIYQLCIQLKSKEQNIALTNILSNIGCSTLKFEQYVAPLILRINELTDLDGDVLNEYQNQPLTILATPPVFSKGDFKVVNFAYNVKIIEVPDGDIPNTILDGLIAGNETRNYMVNKDLGTFTAVDQQNFTLESFDFVNGQGFEVGKQYAVFLQATSGVDILPNNGYSQVAWFFYGKMPDDLEADNSILAGLPPECSSGTYSNIPLPTTQGESVAQINVYEAIRIGCFYVSVKEITKTGDKYNGVGTVNLPYMDAKFLVSLNNLEVKSYDGTLVATSGNAVGKFHTVDPPTGIVAELYDSFLTAKGIILPAINTGADVASQAASEVQGENREAMVTVNQTVQGLENLNLPPDIMAKIYAKQAAAQVVSNDVSEITAGVRAGAIMVKNGADVVANTIESIFDGLRSVDRLVQQVSNSDFETGLPIGIDTKIENENLRIGVFGLLFTPTHAGVDLVVETPTIPGINNRLYFGSNNVAISPEDFSFGNATFYLGGDIVANLPDGNGLKLIGTGQDRAANNGTYLKLKEYDIDVLQISGGFIFSNSLFTPLRGNENVVASVYAQFNNFDDFIINTTTSSEFRLTTNKNFKFALEELSIDFSSTSNIDENTNPDTWTGIYFKKIGLAIPSDFSDDPLSAKISNFYFPFGNGKVSFEATALSLLNISTGSLGGISFGIDKFYVKVQDEVIEDIYLAGTLKIKMFDTEMPYNLPLKDIFNDNTGNETGKLPVVKLTFQLPEDVELRINSMHTSFKLGASSYITYNSGGHTVNGALDPSRKIQFMLHGSMTIKSEGDGLDLPSMTFNNFFFDGREIDKEQFKVGFASPQKYVGSTSKDGTAGAFPINLTDFYPVFGLENGQIKFGLGFEVVVNLMEKAGFGAATKIEVSHNFGLDLTPVPGTFKFTFKKISIQTDVSIAKISGELEFLKDEIWGNGFRGCIRLELAKPAPIVAQVQGIFGSKGTGNEAFRYFFVEGMAKGINAVIPSTTLALDGFAGGLWYNMEKTAGGISTAARLNGNQTGCTAPSLIPTKERMGIYFGVMFKEAGSQGFAFNGVMVFEAQLTTDFEPISFEVSGAGNFVKMPVQGGAISSVSENRDHIKIAADISLEYDFTQNILSGEFNVFLNINDVLRGGNGNDNAGRMVMYFGRNDWYIYIGNPWGRGGDPGGLLDGSEEQKYASVMVDLPDELGSIEAGAYICMGTWGISGLPPLPIARKLPIPDDLRTELERYRPQLDARASNGGIAFGAFVRVDIDVNFEIIRGYLKAGFGFDLALVQYGNNVNCDDGPNIKGINGAYATGQIYGYAKCGLEVKISGYDPYTIAQADVKLSASFGGPNPYWLEGKITISKATLVSAVDVVLGAATGGVSNAANALGEGFDGLIGDDPATSYTEDIINEAFPNGLDIPVKFGRKCVPDATQAAELADRTGSSSIFSHFTPGVSDNNTRKISKNQAIEIHFNKNINHHWETLTNGSNQYRKWDIKEITIKRGTQIIRNSRIDESGQLVKIYLAENVNNGNTIRLTLKLQLKKFVNSQWSWMPTYADGSTTNDVQTVDFIVEADSPAISVSQVVEAYPTQFHEHYLQGASINKMLKNGFIKLSQTKEPIKNSPIKLVKFFANGSTITTGSFSYTESERAGVIKYDIPALPLNATIKAEFWIKNEKVALQKISTTNPTTKGIPRQEYDSTQVFELNFTTSKHRTFSEKMASCSQPSFSHEAENYTMTTYFNSDEDFNNLETEKQIVLRKNRLATVWHELYIPRITAALRSMRFDEQNHDDYYCRYINELKPKLNYSEGKLKIDIWANDPLMNVAHREGMIIGDPLQGDYQIDFDYQVPFCDTDGTITYSYISDRVTTQPSNGRDSRSADNSNIQIQSTNNSNTNISVIDPIDFTKTIHYLGYRETINQQVTAALMGMNQIIAANVKMPLTIVNLQIISQNAK